jgi:uncharacterized protein YyaL (SSP411 family)
MEPARDVTNHTTAIDTATAGVGTTRPVADGASARAAKLQDYAQLALATTDPLEAHLGLVNSDLLTLAYTMNSKIIDSLTDNSGAVDGIEQGARAVDQYLRIVKQIERYAQLAIKLSTAREHAVQQVREAVNGRLGNREVLKN